MINAARVFRIFLLLIDSFSRKQELIKNCYS